MVEENRSTVWVVIVILGVMGAFTVLIWTPWGGYMSGMMGMMGFSGGLMFLVPSAFLVLIALGAYYLLTGPTRTNVPSPGSSGRPLAILQERYARGEITREQYLKIKTEIET